MFRKMVVALDGSDLSKKALEAAVQLAAEQNSELHLLHVVKEVVIPPYVVGEIAYATRDYNTELNEVLRNEGQELLKEAMEKAEGAKLVSRTILITGDPATEIVNYARDNAMQLVVMGSRGLGTLKEMMLGSVSHKVAQLAPCPVLIIK